MSRRFNKLLKDSGMVLSQPRTRSTSHSKDMNTLCQDINLELLSVGGTTDGEGEDEDDVEIREDNRVEQSEVQTNTDVDKRADRIISQIERNSTLMTNDPLAEQLRIETLKELTQSLSVKRTVRAKLVQTVSQNNKVHPIGFFRRLKYRLSIAFTRVRMWIHDLVYGYELWYGSLKTIEGHFGSDVASYFKFLRWLFLYNCFVFIMSFIFVIIPQGIYVEKYKRNGVAHVDNILTSVSDVMSSSINTPSKNLSQFAISDFITGQGFFTNSTMYYGFYTDQSLKIGSFIYSIPTAYFFTAFFSYLFVFITLSIRMAKSYRTSFIETSGGVKNVYALKIICAWDFSIADDNAAKLKSETLSRELREMLAEDLKSSYQKSKSMQHVYIVMVRCVVHLLFFLMLGGTGILVYTLLNRLLLNKLNSHTSGLVTAVIPGKYVPKLSTSLNDIGDDGSDDDVDESERDWQVDPIFMSFVVTFLLIIMPLLFSWIVRFERYNDPRTSLYITMVRTFVLECVVVAVLVIFWLGRSSSKCWETSLGQAVYRLILMDFLLSGVALTCVEFLRSILQRNICQDLLLAAEFDIARNTLNLIYNQTLFWVGFYFSPPLSLVIVLKLFLSFHVKKFSLLYNCAPSSSSNWRSAQAQTLFLVLSFISLLAVLMNHGYIITSVKTSDCGPLKGSVYMYERILEGVFQLRHGNDFWAFIMFLRKPGVVAGLLLSMCGGVYYLREKSLAQKKMVKILRGMLVAESKDKEFLLKQISFLTGGRKSRPGSQPQQRKDLFMHENIFRK